MVCQLARRQASPYAVVVSLFKVNVVARNPKDETKGTAPLEALVDTDSDLTWLPADALVPPLGRPTLPAAPPMPELALLPALAPLPALALLPALAPPALLPPAEAIVPATPATQPRVASSRQAAVEVGPVAGQPAAAPGPSTARLGAKPECG